MIFRKKVVIINCSKTAFKGRFLEAENKDEYAQSKNVNFFRDWEAND